MATDMLISPKKFIRNENDVASTSYRLGKTVSSPVTFLVLERIWNGIAEPKKIQKMSNKYRYWSSQFLYGSNTSLEWRFRKAWEGRKFQISANIIQIDSAVEFVSFVGL